MPKRKEYNGANIGAAKHAEILSLLCAGLTINEVARKTNSQWLTVRQVQWRNATKVEDAKKLLAERAEHLASDALDLLHHKVISQPDKLTPGNLVPIFGVAVDKALALRADPTIYVQHSHQHIHAHITESTMDEILSHLPTDSPSVEQPKLVQGSDQ